MKRQVPIPPNEWLTRLSTKNELERKFSKGLALPDDASLWEEWTQEQWQEWQDKYNPQPEPTEEAELNE